MRPNLQLALDMTDLEKAIQLCEICAAWIDWIEAGTSLVINAGLHAVKTLKKEFPQKTVVADVKIADAAKMIAGLVIASDADVLTVLSAASDQTIATCVDIAHEHGRQVLGDHISTRLSAEACLRLADLGCDLVGIHIPKDSGESIALNSIEDLLHKIRVPFVLAGGIKTNLLQQMVGWPITSVVVGGAILNHPDPAGEAKKFAAILDTWQV